MVTLTQEIEESLREAKTAFLATSSKDGIPNVVPIAAFTVLDDGTMLISDQYFNKTLQNMQENPQIALSWWGAKGGFQIKGTVTLHTNDEVFSTERCLDEGALAQIRAQIRGARDDHRCVPR